MKRLRAEKLHVSFAGGIQVDGPIDRRRYTLTHSDATGDLYLTVAAEYDEEQVSGWITRFMRDEVLAEWQVDGDRSSLHLYCHVSGGVVLGSAGWRYAIFKRELPLVLEAFRYGDRHLFDAYPELDEVPVMVHFRSHRRRFNRTEQWGTPGDYRP